MNLHRTIPLLLALLAPAAAHAIPNEPIEEPDPGEPGGGGDDPVDTGYWAKNYSKSALFGSSSWGAGYKINGGVWALPAAGDFKDRLGARLNAESYAKLNGSYLRVLGARATGETEAKRKTALSFNAYVGSATIYTKSWTSLTSTQTLFNVAPSPWTVTFIDRSVTVGVYGIDVTFRVKASGELKANLTGKLSNVGLEAAGTPSGKASLYASAAVGHNYCAAGVCVGAEAGVYSDVDLVKVSVPAKAATWWSLAPAGVQINYLAKADATISSLAGELGVWAKACIIGCIGGTEELISWDGFTATYPIANFSGSYCLAGTCLSTSSSSTLEN